LFKFVVDTGGVHIRGSPHKLVLERKREADPLRWSRGVRNCQPAGPVSLNPEKESINSEQKDVA
tara:strand:- start:325 stop:516 length:192 start_codon:yes stop_codon:yes gene_type:complete